MHAIRIHAYGGPEVMQLEELPTPVPGPGQVRVRVEAASVNFLDVQKRRGELVGQAFYRRAGTMNLTFRQPWAARELESWKSLVPRFSNVHVGDRVVFRREIHTPRTLLLRPRG